MRPWAMRNTLSCKRIHSSLNYLKAGDESAFTQTRQLSSQFLYAFVIHPIPAYPKVHISSPDQFQKSPLLTVQARIRVQNLETRKRESLHFAWINLSLPHALSPLRLRDSKKNSEPITILHKLEELSNKKNRPMAIFIFGPCFA